MRIYVSDTLTPRAPRQARTQDGALARTRVVLAHELGHHVHHDVWRLLAASTLVTAGVSPAPGWGSWLLAQPARGTSRRFLRRSSARFSASRLSAPGLAAHSRRRERAADAYALALTGEGDTLARAVEVLVAVGNPEPARAAPRLPPLDLVAPDPS